MNIIEIYNSLLQGNIDMVYQYRRELNERILQLLQKNTLTSEEVSELKTIIMIGNITYDNLPLENLPIENGIWDMMVETFRKYTKEDIYPVGSPPIKFKHVSDDMVKEENLQPLMIPISEESKKYKSNMLFPELVTYQEPRLIGLEPAYVLDNTQKMSKRTRNTSHEHPDLVGTFDKCKFVLTEQAKHHGVLDDPKVRILERDFFVPLLQRGVIGYNEEITIIAELKYDGISVEADVSDKVLSARTRGDTGEGVTSDITPILEGYDFGNHIDEVIGMKFEAIVTNQNLIRLREMGIKYINCRTAISGLTGNSIGRKYRDFITLVPIATDKRINGVPIDRLVELEFLNNFYSKEIPMRYSVFSGNYASILFQMKKYVEEAEFARSSLPFMYDGVVFEFYDPKIRQMLGRDHSMDRYKVAIKFNPLKKQSIFRYYDYSIGQDGSITPMIHYDPVEFMGTIHTKSTGHSYERFKTLDLHEGDMIDIEYTNDVMPYVYKTNNSFNAKNSYKPYTALDSFPEYCPCCGTELTISDSGKSIKCLNLYCYEREVKRMKSTFDKLGIEDFAESAIRTIGYTHLYQYLNVKDPETFKVLGDTNKIKLFNQLQRLKSNPIPDYKIIGSLGFTSVAQKTWKLIFDNISLESFLHYYHAYNGDMTNIYTQLISIKGIGDMTIKTILDEFSYFADDIDCICNTIKIQNSADMGTRLKIRFTGCRDKQLIQQLSNKYDIDGDAGVTKDTSILLIPYHGYTQGSKYEKALRYGVTIVPLEEFKQNMHQFL